MLFDACTSNPTESPRCLECLAPEINAVLMHATLKKKTLLELLENSLPDGSQIRFVENADQAMQAVAEMAPCIVVVDATTDNNAHSAAQMFARGVRKNPLVRTILLGANFEDIDTSLFDSYIIASANDAEMRLIFTINVLRAELMEN